MNGYKGNTPAAGEISGLMILEPDCTAVSSNPAIVSVKSVVGHWAAVANALGTAIITVTAPDGRTGNVTITVESAVPSAPAGGNVAAVTDNMEVRQELIRLINQTREANGVAELPVSETLMNAALPVTEDGNTPPAPDAPPPDMVKSVAGTTFDIYFHFSQTSRETFTDKVLRLIQSDTLT